ncbi:MAG: hypothetical protein LUG27_11330 [Clostridiales bacterium]|nr:hypothetical protein [Clostridiales bacterium]
MPGGMGGIGGMIGGMLGGGGGMGGMGGMGGPGGGMGGMMGGMNGQNQNNQNTQNMQTNTSDVYDVDRWKRSDDIDQGTNTSAVKMVRDAWEQEDAKKKEKSLRRKSNRKMTGIFAKKRKKEETEAVEKAMERPAGGTVHTPEMKLAEHNIKSVDRQNAEAEAARAAALAAAMEAERLRQAAEKPFNYLGLTSRSSIEPFFTSNPVNSLTLAVDSLAFGSLTLNQTTRTAVAGMPSAMALQHMAASGMTGLPGAAGLAGAPGLPGAAEAPGTPGAAGTSAAGFTGIPAQAGTADASYMPQGTLVGGTIQTPGAMLTMSGAPEHAAKSRNLISSQTGTGYMDMVYANRQKQKYDVRIT